MLVTIQDKKLIPGIGRGPITEPINVTPTTYHQLITAGYHVFRIRQKPLKLKKHNDVKKENQSAAKKELSKEVSTSKEETKKELSKEVPASKEETKKELSKEVPASKEETKKETKNPVSKKNTIIIDGKEKDPEDVVKRELQKELNSRKIEYKYNSNRDQLISLIKSDDLSNQK